MELGLNIDCDELLHICARASSGHSKNVQAGAGTSLTNLERILWRDDSILKVETYELSTVTYGTSPASFLVTRCLQNLAEQHSLKCPVGSTSIKRNFYNFYIDDLLTEADTIQKSIAIQNETIQLFSLGAFKLSKWASNRPQLLKIVNNRKSKLILAVTEEIHTFWESYVGIKLQTRFISRINWTLARAQRTILSVV